MWEDIFVNADEATMRMQVPEGWVVQTVLYKNKQPISTALCFVPDASKEWVL